MLWMKAKVKPLLLSWVALLSLAKVGAGALYNASTY